MSFFQDLRFALRVLGRKPVFTLVVVATLALGIGAGSAMYSMVHALVLRPFDLPDLDRLAVIQEKMPNDNEFFNNLSPRGFLDYQADARSFDQMAAFQWWDVALTGNGDPEDVTGFQVSPGYFDILGVKPQLGRWFAADEIDGQKDHVAILSHQLWDRRYGRDPAILGKQVNVDGGSYTVIGVMPRDFRIPNQAELWAPLTLDAKQRQDRGSHYLGAIARLKPDVSLEDAHAEMHQMGERHAALYSEDAKHELRVVSLTNGLTEDFTRRFIWTLLGAALFVLLIACANVANLFLAHTMSRRKELAVRAALGAGRARIVRQLLTEAVVLGVIAGLVSLLFAAWSVDLVKDAISPNIVRFVPGWDKMGVSTPVLLFALAVGVGVGMLFGVVPAWQVSRTDVNSVLKDGDRGTTAGRQTHRLRNSLVVAQVALALVLLIGAGTMVKGFIRMASPGGWMDGKNVLTMFVSLPEGRYGHREERTRFASAVVDRLRALPGVVDASAVNNVPWGQHGWTRIVYPEGQVVRAGEELQVDFRYEMPGYQRLLHIPQLEGRALDASDTQDAAPVAMVSAYTAKRLWPDEPAVGKRFRWSAKDDDAHWITVVGVVGDVQDRPDEKGPRPSIYVPLAQESTGQIYFLLRTEGDPLLAAHAAQAAIYDIDPAEPVSEVRSMELVLSERLSGFRVGAGMMSGFALLALLLAAVGIYGVVATLVAQRTHEIGVRMALGARRGDVLRMILKKGVALTVLGLVPGLVVGVLLVGMVDRALPGIVDQDVAVFAIITLLVGTMSLIGSLIPAWRATRVDPLVALRRD